MCSDVPRSGDQDFGLPVGPHRSLQERTAPTGSQCGKPYCLAERQLRGPFECGGVLGLSMLAVKVLKPADSLAASDQAGSSRSRSTNG